MRAFRHIWILLTLLVVSPVTAAELQPGFFPVHRSEPFFLNRPIDGVLLHGLRIWDPRLSNWRATQANEIPAERVPVLVLHLWADWCVPCREEFPIVRDLIDGLAKTYGERVKVVLLSETSAPEAMRAFLDNQRKNLPKSPHYLDVGEGVAAVLRADLPTPLAYPITLVLDAQRVVRHAVVGPISGRRAALLATIALLLDEQRSQTKPSLR